MEAAVKAFHCALGTVLDQVEVEVDKERVEERRHFVAVLGFRIGEEIPQPSELHFILLGLCLARGRRHYVGTTRFRLDCEAGGHLLGALRQPQALLQRAVRVPVLPAFEVAGHGHLDVLGAHPFHD